MFPQAVWDSLCWLELATAPRWAPARALLSGARARLVYSPPLNRCGISCSTAMKKKVANRNVGDRSPRRFATPADFPRHECSPYWGQHIRTRKCGICPSFKAHSLSPRANP